MDVSSLISPDLLKNLTSSEAIKAFGEQLLNKAKDKVVAAVKGKIQEIEDKILALKKAEIQFKIDHRKELIRLKTLHKGKEITDHEYEVAVRIENTHYEEGLKAYKELKQKLKDDLKKELKDRRKKLKEDLKKLKQKRTKLTAEQKKARAKARKAKLKKLAKNAAKTLAPIVAMYLAEELIKVISQRSKLEQIVIVVNAYIDKVNQQYDPKTFKIATQLRDNAINLINNSIKKLKGIQDAILQIDLYISIFTIIVAILSAIPVPTAVPPGIGVPVSVITRIVNQLQKAVKLIASLAVISAVALALLEKEVSALQDLIDQLHAINQSIDDKAAQLDQNDLTSLIDSIGYSGNDYPEYKGFKFAIKEEQTLGASQAVVVKGIKRHYAVAINRDGSEVVRSENSFTQDPQVLVDSVKIIIDQQNLQG
jgi:DNA repair exonuclease SbcCD ATPase subunit